MDFRRRDEWGEPIAENGWRGYIPRGLPVSYSGLILLACIVVFLISLILPGFVYNYLALNPEYLMQRPWTLITYMFVHADFNHLFWNMLFLFFFAMELERRVGESKFLQIYILSGIVAALGQMMISGGSMVGASGALFGVLGCLAMIAPEIRILLFFVIPMSIRGAVVLFALIDFLSMSSADNIAHMAHIVGLLVGLAYGQAMRRSPSYYWQ
ncbi:MAG TPA: rhomboid family intramembrane serine protease [Methanothrix sp.]|nr:rhomboid family intramembrane serine protease [Methanothrix sp.]